MKYIKYLILSIVIFGVFNFSFANEYEELLESDVEYTDNVLKNDLGEEIITEASKDELNYQLGAEHLGNDKNNRLSIDKKNQKAGCGKECEELRERLDALEGKVTDAHKRIDFLKVTKSSNDANGLESTQQFKLINGKIAVDENGLSHEIRTDKNGRKYFVDAEGNTHYLDENKIEPSLKDKKFVSASGKVYDIETDENGNKIVTLADGTKVKVQKDENGREYFINENGEREYLDKGTMIDANKLKTSNKKFVSASGKVYDIKTDANGNKIVTLADGTKRVVQKDENGREYFINENGEREYLDQGTMIDASKSNISDKKFVSASGKVYDIKTDENGNKIVTLADGTKVMVQKDENGREYFINENGEKEYLDQGTIVDTSSKKFVSGSGKVYDVSTDENGNKIVTLPDGTKRVVQKDENGREYFINENGEREYLDQGTMIDTTKSKTPDKKFVSASGKVYDVNIDKYGNKVVTLPNGQKAIVKKDANGREYFINENGEKEYLDQGTMIDVKDKKFVSASGKVYDIETDENGNKIVTLPDGTKVKVQKDANGREYFINENGEKEYLDQGKIIENANNKFVSASGKVYDIETDENGNKIVTLPDGTKVMVQKDENGREYFINENGEKEYLDQGTIVGPTNSSQSKKLVTKNGKVYDITTDANGNKIVTLPNGKKVKVKKDANGREYFINENGEKVYLDESTIVDPTSKKLISKQGISYDITTDENGNKIVTLPNGKKVKVKKDENGREYFINENGEKVYLDESTIVDTSVNTPVKKVDGYYDQNGNFIEYLDGVNGTYQANGSFKLFENNSKNEDEINLTHSDKTDSERNKEIALKMSLDDSIDILEMFKSIESDLSSATITAVSKIRGYQVDADYKIDDSQSNDKNKTIENEESEKITALCEVSEDKEVMGESSMLEMYCESPQIGTIIVLSELAIKNSNNVAQLIGTPISISTDLGFGEKPEIFYEIDKSNTKGNFLVNNRTKNKNIATWIDKKQMENWAKNLTNETYTLVKDSVKSYQDALTAYNTATEETKNIDGTTTITTSGTGNKPELINYIEPQYYSFALALLKTGIDEFTKDNPYLYGIDKGTILKLYVSVKKVQNSERK